MIAGQEAARVSLWITEAEVVRLMDMKGAIAALDRALALEAAGKAENMVKTHVIWGGHHTLHAIGATFAEEGFVGTKTWAHANGAAPLLILFDSHNGSLKAIIEACALGQCAPAGSAGWRRNTWRPTALRHGADRHREAGHDAARRRGRRAPASARARLSRDGAAGRSSSGGPGRR